MNPKIREVFDRELEQVVSELPPLIKDLMQEVPLLVEDYPSTQIMAETGTRHRGELCGIYIGIPIIDQSVNDWGVPSPVVTLFREGLLDQSASDRGEVDLEELRRQIRITILHEYGHHHGLDEDDLDDLGYG